MFFLKAHKNLLAIIFILCIILAYVANITAIPKDIILFQNEDIDLKIISGVKLEETLEVSSNINDSKTKKSREYKLSLLGIKLKKINAEIIPETKVIPLGNIIGLKLYTKGVLVVGLTEIKDESGKVYKPYEETKIKEGDSIVKIDNVEVKTAEELINCVAKAKGEEVSITYISDEEEKEEKIKPVKTSKNTYKLGIWVRDSAAGIGTATFYSKEKNICATLGHSIQDIDTGELVEISTGELVTTNVVNVEKGEKNNPGRIEGSIEESKNIGEIYSNTNFGLYSKVENKELLNIDESKEMYVASRKEIQEGKASILCTIEDGKTEEYEINIQKIFKNNNENNKSMIVKVTDEKLLKKTGGIIQGMSGSPVIQNGKFIGALTHVLVSDPTTGYAVFADMMINQMKEVE